MRTQRTLALILALAMVLCLSACGTPAETTPSTTESPVVTTQPVALAPVSLTGTQNVVVEGFEWGPAVTKVILTLDQAVSADSVHAEAFAITEVKESFNWAYFADPTLDPTVHVTSEAPRTVANAYTCDAQGNPSGDSNTIALELVYNSNEGSPYCYDLLTSKNTVCNPYELHLTLTEQANLVTSNGAAVEGLAVEAGIDLATALYPQLDDVDLTGSFTGTDGRTLTYGSYTPAEDGESHPLVVWLHGAGEGGQDPSIPILGAQVTALYDETFQSTLGGAYVLTPQTPGFWMEYDEEASWGENPGVSSLYHETLWELIQAYVAEHPDIDANRIYVGGCSNGGYMTMDLVIQHPDYFAAAFPICEAYRDSGITDEQIAALKDVPMWFVYAENDTTVLPSDYEIPTIARLQAIEADVHVSAFADVGEYMGHWSWVYFFNNQCEENGVNLWQWLAQQRN